MKLEKKTARYPEKTTINLVIHEKDINSPSRAIPLFVGMLLLVALFCKVFVLDPLATVAAAQARVDDLQQEITALEEKQASYGDLKEQYRRYGTGWMNEDEAGLADRMEVLSLIEYYIMPHATVQNLRLSKNILTINISGITLEQASVIVQELKSDIMVDDVMVYTASNTAQTVATLISMTVTLNPLSSNQVNNQPAASSQGGVTND